MATSRKKSPTTRKPNREEAEAAVRTLLAWVGEDPARRGLQKTPGRFLGAYEDWFAGYKVDPYALLGTSFHQVDNYDRMVALTHIDFESHCEHHGAPVIGVAHVAYLPDRRVVGISKLARVVELYARRLQIQEKLTAQIATAIHDVLKPRGVGVVIEADHACMTTRGVHKPGVLMVTRRLLGCFREDPVRREFLAMVGS